MALSQTAAEYFSCTMNSKLEFPRFSIRFCCNYLNPRSASLIWERMNDLYFNKGNHIRSLVNLVLENVFKAPGMSPDILARSMWLMTT